mmetsp:Transcript_31297/g.66139  ORF Transcript_31297/g.66139 Transcript_31297/m.66139 type:complete len:82 (-) Transcript_31297:299-544(-)
MVKVENLGSTTFKKIQLIARISIHLRLGPNAIVEHTLPPTKQAINNFEKWNPAPKFGPSKKAATTRGSSPKSSTGPTRKFN